MLTFVARNWQELADYIRGELAHKSWSQQDLADAAGVSLKSVSLLLSGKPRSRMPTAVPKIEAALGWAPGTARGFLDKSSPRQASPPATSEALHELKLRILNDPEVSAEDKLRLVEKIADIERTLGERYPKILDRT